MKLLPFLSRLVIFGVLISSVELLHAQVFQYGKAESKEFLITQKSKYLIQHYLYDESLAVINEGPKYNEGPDVELLALISSIVTQDYPRWLALWDAESQAAWSGGVGEQYFSSLKFSLENEKLKDKIRLTRWIEVGLTVLIGYALIEDGVELEEVLIPFKVTNDVSKWKAIKEIMESALYDSFKKLPQ